MTDQTVLAKNLGKTLGIEFKDCVSGFEGTCTAVCFELYGEPHFRLNPKGLKDCAPIPGQWFDASRMRVNE